jgi:hypothetical protein
VHAYDDTGRLPRPRELRGARELRRHFRRSRPRKRSGQKSPGSAGRPPGAVPRRQLPVRRRCFAGHEAGGTDGVRRDQSQHFAHLPPRACMRRTRCLQGGGHRHRSAPVAAGAGVSPAYRTAGVWAVPELASIIFPNRGTGKPDPGYFSARAWRTTSDATSVRRRRCARASPRIRSNASRGEIPSRAIRTPLACSMTTRASSAC